MEDPRAFAEWAGMALFGALYLVTLWELYPGWKARLALSLPVLLPVQMQMFLLGAVLLWLHKDEKIARRDTLGTGQRGPSRPTPSAPTEGVRLGPRPL